MSNSKSRIKVRGYQEVEMMVRLAHDIRTDEMTLRNLAMTGIPSIMTVVAQHPRTEPDLLHFLSETPYPQVVMAVAGNPNILPKTAECLLRYRPCIQLAWLLYSNPATPPELLCDINGAYRYFRDWCQYSFHGKVSDDAKNVDADYVDLPSSLYPTKLRDKIEEIIKKLDHNVFGGHRFLINDSPHHPFFSINLSRGLKFEEALELLNTADQLSSYRFLTKMKVLGLVFRQKDLDHERLFKESKAIRNTIEEIFKNDAESLMFSYLTYLPYEFILRVIDENELRKRYENEYIPLFHFIPTNQIENDRKYFFPHLPPQEFGRGGEWRQVFHENCPHAVRELVFDVLEKVLGSNDEKMHLPKLMQVTTDDSFVLRFVDRVNQIDSDFTSFLAWALLSFNPHIKVPTIEKVVNMLPDDQKEILMGEVYARMICSIDNPVDFNRLLENGKIPISIAVFHPATDWNVFERRFHECLQTKKWNIRDTSLFSQWPDNRLHVQRMIQKNPLFADKTIEHFFEQNHDAAGTERNGLGV